jgi:beta-lactamase class A
MRFPTNAVWRRVTFASALTIAGAPVQAEPPQSGLGAVQSDIAGIARIGAGKAGKVGIVAWRLDGRGPRVLINADEAFPMASTFKVAVAGAVLQRIQDGKLGLDTMITIDQDRKIDSPTIAKRLIHPGVALSVYNLLELMLTDSDNTATDYLVDAAGGTGAIMDWVHAQGVRGLRIDGATDEVIRRFFHLGKGPFPQELKDAIAARPGLLAMADKPDSVFDADPRDTASPMAMGQLLTRIFNGKALDTERTSILIGMMTRDETGLQRLRGLMPPGTEVADKTGTVGGSINDVGAITLPDGSRIVVVVYIKGSDASIPAREKAIAQIGRAVRDYYAYAQSP